MVFTTSWDDGHPLDLRLAELLSKHGVAATFYCPLRNLEGLPVMQSTERRALETQGFEIGAHTLDHAYANRMPRNVWRKQVIAGKSRLEDELGHAVQGFCYPGGKQAPWARQIVADAGFHYARTTGNFRADPGTDPLAIPTSLQLFPHAKTVLLRNYLLQRNWPARLQLARLCLSSNDLEDRLFRVLEACSRHECTLHLWGHSWEIDRLGLWPLLDRFLAEVASQVPPSQRWTNAQVAQAMRAVR